ncbi:MAG: hypothetical protein J7K68_04280 [Candidatus Diapherotrites archaeon]|nr:hypothetical protein [Candidatus Diapherotrites archaeon]
MVKKQDIESELKKIREEMEELEGVIERTGKTVDKVIENTKEMHPGLSEEEIRKRLLRGFPIGNKKVYVGVYVDADHEKVPQYEIETMSREIAEFILHETEKHVSALERMRELEKREAELTKKLEEFEERKEGVSRRMGEIDKEIRNIELEREKLSKEFEKLLKHNMQSYKALNEIQEGLLKKIKKMGLDEKTMKALEYEFNAVTKHPLWKHIRDVRLDIDRGIIPDERIIDEIIEIGKDVPEEGVTYKHEGIIKKFGEGGFPTLREHGETFKEVLKTIRRVNELKQRAEEYSKKTLALHTRLINENKRRMDTIKELKKKREKLARRLAR